MIYEKKMQGPPINTIFNDIYDSAIPKK